MSAGTDGGTIPRDDLDALAPPLRARLIASATLSEQARGAVLVGDGTGDGTALRIVSSGLLALQAHDPDARPLALYHAGRTIHPARPTVRGMRWSLTALAKSNVYEVSLDALSAVANEPDFAAWRMGVVEADRLRAIDLLAAMGTPDAGERLLRLVGIAGVPTADPDRFGWPLTQTQFAALAGLSRAHLNARLSALKADGRLVIEDRIARLGACSTLLEPRDGSSSRP